jgi:hypothetical protein
VPSNAFVISPFTVTCSAIREVLPQERVFYTDEFASMIDWSCYKHYRCCYHYEAKVLTKTRAAHWGWWAWASCTSLLQVYVQLTWAETACHACTRTLEQRRPR